MIYRTLCVPIVGVLRRCLRIHYLSTKINASRKGPLSATPEQCGCLWNSQNKDAENVQSQQCLELGKAYFMVENQRHSLSADVPKDVEKIRAAMSLKLKRTL